MTRSASALAAWILYRVVESLVRILPITVCWYAGVLLGWTAGILLPGYRRLALRNLTIAFGAEMPPRRLRALRRSHFARLGGNLLTSLKLPWMKPEAVRARFEIEGIEHVEAAIARGRGFIYALCHTGNWEILTRLPDVAPGTKRGAMYQRLGNERLNAHVVRGRSNAGCHLFDRRDGFSAPARFLRENGGLGILVDQHSGDGGVWCPFFGRLASTTTLAQLLSKRTGAPVLPATVVTTGPARWRFVIGPPLPGGADGLTPDQAAAEMNLRLEEMIRRSPADWFWVHNRWKTPNPDFLLTRYRRGIVLPNGWTPDRLQNFEIVVRSPNWLGDACMAIPSVRAIRRGRPDARLTVLTPSNLAPLWRQVPEADRVVAIPRVGGIPVAVRALRRQRIPWDVAILFPNSLRSALEAWLAGVPRIAGYAGHSRKWLLKQIVPPRKRPGPVRHHFRHYLRIAWHAGADITDPALTDTLPQSDPSRSELPRLGVCPGAEYGPAKRWPLERFAAAIRMAAESVSFQPVLLGGPKEKALGRELAEMLGGDCENLIGRTSMEELIREVRRCRALLTNDTGTMHLAAALGVPVVAIFGSTEPAWTGPLGNGHTVIRHHVPCSPCFLRECPLDFRCMLSVDAGEVSEAVVAKLGSPEETLSVQDAQ